MNHHRSRRSPHAPRSHAPRWTTGAVLGLLAIAAGAAGTAGLASCKAQAFIFNYNDCENRDVGHLDPEGNLDECHCYEDPEGALCVDSLCRHVAPVEEPLCAREAGGGGDAGADASEDGPPPGCTGQCLPAPPLGWTAPVQLWFGEESGAPTCPEVAPAVGYEGRAELHAAPATCGACSCGPSGGECELPATLTASAASCASTNAITPRTDFDPPASWDGSCSANEAIALDKLCGSVKCVSSLTTAPLTLDEGGCASTSQPAPEALSPPAWSTFARACMGSVSGACESLGEVCTPASIIDGGVVGFRTCIFHGGDVACPSAGPYTDRHVFYTDYADSRGCSECGCGVPVGSACSAMLSVYTDPGCSAPIFTRIIEATSATCDDLSAGTQLGSKKIGPVTYTPGQCAASGGEPGGSAEPVLPSTFCCSPAP